MVREFSVIVGIDAGRARRGAREFKAGADTVTRSSKRMERGLRGANRRAVALITTLGRIRGVATLAFAGFLGVGGLSSVVRTIGDFEQSMKRVEALLGDRGAGGAIEALTMKAREMGATTAFTATQAAEGMSFLTMAGFDAVQTYAAVEHTLNLAAAGMLGLGESADIVSNIMQGFGVEAERTEEVVDALAFVSARTNTNIRQLGEAMKFVAPVAGKVGLDVKEVTAALGLLGNSGLQASLAGTSLRRSISGLLNPSREAAKALNQMGLDAGELVAAMADPDKGLEYVVRRLAGAGLDAADAFVLFGQRGAPGILSLTQQVDKLATFNEEMQKITGTARDMGKVMLDSLQGDGRIALSALQEGILRLGEAGLRKWLREVVQEFTAFIRGLFAIEQNLENSSAAMRKWAERGEWVRDNITNLRKALIILIAYMNRAVIAAFLNGAVAVVGFGRALFAGATAAQVANRAILLLAANMTVLRGLLLTTGIGALAVLAGWLIDNALFSKDAANATIDYSDALKTQADAVDDLTFKFDTLDESMKKAAVTQLEMFSAELEANITRTSRALINQATATENLARIESELVVARQNLRDASAGRDADEFSGILEEGEARQRLTVLLQEQAYYQSLLDTTQGQSAELLEEYEKQLDSTTQRLELMKKVVDGTYKSYKEAVAAQNAAKEANELFGESLKEVLGLNAEQLLSIRDLVKEFTKEDQKIQELEESIDTLNGVKEYFGKIEEKLQLPVGTLTRLLDDQEKQLRKLRTELTPGTKKLEGLREEIEDLNPELTKGAQLQLELGRAVRDAAREYMKGELTLEEYREAVELINEKYRLLEENLCDANEKVRECTEDSTERMDKAWESAITNIQSAIAEFIKGGLDDFGSFADNIVDVFKSMIAEMLAAWATSGLMNIFQGKAFGAGGNSFPFADIIGNVFGGGGGGAGGSSGGMGNIGSSLVGLWDGAKAFFSEAAFFLGEFAGGFSGFFTGVGGGTSATTFAGAGNWAAAGGSALAGAGVGAIAGLGVDALVGSRGDPTATVVLSAVGGIIGSIIPGIGTILGAAIGGAVGGFVSNLIGGAKKLEQATLEFSGSVDGVNATIETVVSKQRSFFRGRKFTTKRDDLDTSGINEIIAQVEQVITDTAAMLGVSADALSNFSIDREINVKGKTSEQIEALLEELFSDVILGLIGAFVDGTEGLSERLQKSLETFKGNADEFLQAFQLLATVDLALAIDPVAAVQEAIAAESVSMTDAYKSVLASYRELVENYDGSLESLTALTQATLVLKEVQAQLAATLISAGQEISATFQGSAQDIREQMMTEEQLYTLRRSQIDDLVEQAMNTTDPEELSRLAEQINTLGLDAWNLLDEDQKAALGQEFVDFFDGMDELFGGQIQLGLDTISNDSSAIDQEVADSMTSAAQAIIDANNAARDFWLEQQDWWRENRYRRYGPNEMNP